MPEPGTQCVACGEPLTIQEGADRCACALCASFHIVDRSGARPSIRLADAKQVQVAQGRAQEDLKLVRADIRFLEGEAAAHRRIIALSVVGIALLSLVGAAILASGSGLFGKADTDPASPPDTILMPTMSMEKQNRLATQTIGAALLLVGLVVATVLPWRRWRAPARALRVSRNNRDVIEALLRRLEERAQPQPR